ncbi:hypothetical protein EC973_009231, partial [Apophysomyces ossiformis]
MPQEDSEGVDTGDGGSSLLADHDLVPTLTEDGDSITNTSRSSSSHTHNLSACNLPMDKSCLESLCVEAIWQRFANRGYSDEALQALCAPLLEQSFTNKAYLGGQYHFIQWTQQNSVDINHYSASDL